jgi:L-iditol 2-dehydrogenase
MRALRRLSTRLYDIQLVEVPDKQVEGYEVKAKVEYAGVCASDIKYAGQQLDVNAKIIPPVTLGHEGSGTVVDIGRNVTSLKVGDRVCIETTVYSCGRCFHCIEGDLNLCDFRRGIGSKADGFFAEYIINKEHHVHRIPDHLSLKAAALMEPLAVSAHLVVEQGQISPTQTVVIMGPGPIGLLSAQIAKAFGTRVILCGTPTSRHRLELALKLGICHVVDNMADLNKLTREITQGNGADVVFECVGSEVAVTNVLQVVRKNGKVILAAAPRDDITVNFTKIFRQQITVLGSMSTKPSSWQMAFKLVERDMVNLEELVTAVYPLDRWQEAFELTKNKQGMKILLRP